MQSFSGPLTSAALSLDGAVDSTATPPHNPGEIIFCNDGRAFRFAEAGGSTLSPGNLQASEAEDTGEQNLSIAAAAVNATSITTTSTVTVTANEYSWGFVVVTATPGLGKTYRIANHLAATAAVVVINLDDPISVALTTDSTIDLVANPFMNLVINPASATGAPVGVAYVALTSGQFGWIQTGGPGVVVADGDAAITVGLQVMASDATAGACENAAANTQTYVGTAITGIASGEYGLALLSLP